MDKKINVAIVGYGNVGKSSLEAILQEPDMTLSGVVRRKIEGKQPPELTNVKVVTNIKDLGKVDVAVLCGPSRSIPNAAGEILSLGINTIDSFDIHSEILPLQKKLQPICEKNNSVAIVSAGWDPGIDSVMRGWFLAMAPKGITYTNYGPGMSMGHTVAVKAIKGVKNALSITVPTGMGIHKRMVYVELDGTVKFEDVEKAIKIDPYFVKDVTHIFEVKNIENLIDMGHGVLMERSGVSGITYNQCFKFEARVNNPALTAQVMVSAARASVRQKPGCYTLLEIPVVDFLHQEKDDLIKALV
jgi:diaminopimelate dehydrogenase